MKVYGLVDISMNNICYGVHGQKETTIKSVDFIIYNLSAELYILVLKH